MKDGESSMEQAELLVQILAEIRQQNAMLQSTIDTTLNLKDIQMCQNML